MPSRCTLVARWTRRLLTSLLVLTAGVASAQEHIVPNSSSLPATCTVGAQYVVTINATLHKMYLCEQTNTWVQQTAGGGGGGGGGTTNIYTGTTTVSGDYTATSSDQQILVNANSAQVTITLPSANLIPGLTFLVKKTDASGNQVIISRSGSDTINGDTTAVLQTQYTAVSVIADGVSSWSLF